MDDWQVMALISSGALAAGIVNGLTGFGSALTGLPIWLHAVEPLTAAQLSCACSVLGHIRTFPAIWSAVDWRRLAPMLAAGLVGVPIGTLILPFVRLDTFKLGVGLVLAAHCSFLLVAAGKVRVAAGGRWFEAAIGFGGGVLGGLAGLSGVLPTAWASLKDWRKDERRVFIQVFNFTVLTAMLVTSVSSGLVGLRSVAAIAVAAPGALVGASLGLRVYRRLVEVRFDRIVLAVLLLSGLALVWSSL